MGSHMLLGWEEGHHGAESLQGKGRRNKMETQAEQACGLQLPKQAKPEYILHKYFALRPQFILPSEHQFNFVWAGSSIPAEHRL